MRKLVLGTLGAIAIAIMSQGTTFAADEEAEEDTAVVITPQAQSSTTTARPTQLTTSGPYTPAGTARDTNLSNQNHSSDQ